MIRQVLGGVKGKQITLLPYFVKQSLGKRGEGIKDPLLIHLGMASLYGWIAYTIYDDFLDEEGNPQKLPVATIAHRALTALFSDPQAISPDFTIFFHHIMDDLEQANAWEVAHCRTQIINDAVSLETLTIPDFGAYEWLAKRSLGHAIAPLAILFSLGYRYYSPEVQNLLGFLSITSLPGN